MKENVENKSWFDPVLTQITSEYLEESYRLWLELETTKSHLALLLTQAKAESKDE